MMICTGRQSTGKFTIVTLFIGAVLLLGARAEARLSSNRLSPDHLAAGRPGAITLADHELAARRLSPKTYALNPEGASELLMTDTGREVLTLIVSCALPAGITLVDQQGGFEFFGELGLAKHWLHNPLDEDGQGWVSACMFARVNEHVVTVPLSYRGPNRALALGTGEAENWTVEQGAFYGNYFTADGEEIACSGRDETVAANALRDCTVQDPQNPALTVCGFVHAGSCGDFAPTYACKDQSKYGFYRDCHDRAVCAVGAHPTCKGDDAPEFDQVVTVYVHK